ncbi:MAG: AI-2E family transporter [Thermomicrobiales bacterium]
MSSVERTKLEVPDAVTDSVERSSGVRIPTLVTKTQIEIPWRTVVRVLMIFATLWLVQRLWSVILMFIIALFFTAALAPFVSRIERRGHRRATAVAITLLTVLALQAVFLVLLLQPLINEGRDLSDNLPQYTSDLTDRFQSRYPDLYNWAQDQADSLQSRGTSVPVDGLVTVASGIVTAISNGLLVFVMTAYMLADGRRIYEWCVRYLPDGPEAKVRRTIPEISHVVSGYVVGQLATSVAFGIFTFAVLSFANVPQALFLALLAAIMDAVPLVGVFIATVPAVLLALTVSVPAAIAVLIAYVVYQQFENYLLAPRVYRGTLQISSFAVLLAVLIGSQLLGIVGALLALPVAAAIPVVERIWIIEPREARKAITPPGFDPVEDAPVQPAS